MSLNRRDFVQSLLAGAALCALPAPLLAAQGKQIILFFSWSGNTRKIAQMLQKKLGCEMLELELVKPYSTDYNTCLDEAKRDQEAEARPQLKTKLPDLKDYDTIFLGYPNWWASIPMPIATLLESQDFSGKTIAPFCSHGGGRLGQSVSAIAKLAPKARVLEGFAVHYGGDSSLSADMDAWLKQHGLGA